MGRRRRKRIKRMPRRSTLLSRYFSCPVCGQQTLTIDFKKAEGPGIKLAIVRCGGCGLNLSMDVPEVLEKIDVYNKVVDMVYEGKLPPPGGLEGEVLAVGESAELPAGEEEQG